MSDGNDVTRSRARMSFLTYLVKIFVNRFRDNFMFFLLFPFRMHTFIAITASSLLRRPQALMTRQHGSISDVGALSVPAFLYAATYYASP